MSFCYICGKSSKDVVDIGTHQNPRSTCHNCSDKKPDEVMEKDEE